MSQELATLVKEVTQDQVRSYAQASGDFNPIHLDTAYAATTPFGRTIVHGMLLVAFISELMTRSFGQPWLQTGQLRVRFKVPAFPGDRLTLSGVVKQVIEEGSCQRVVCGVTCRNQEGQELVVGEASVELAGAVKERSTVE